MRTLWGLSIRTRLIVTMMLSFALLVAMGVFFLVSMTMVDRATVELNTRWLPAVHTLAEMKYKMESHRLRIVRALFSPDPGERGEVLTTADARQGEIERLLDAYGSRLHDPTERKLFTAMRSDWSVYLAEEREIRSALPNLSSFELSRAINNRSRLLFEAVNASVDRVIGFNEQGADRSSSDAVRTFDRAVHANLTFFVCALLLLAAFVALVVHSVSRPIERITSAMRRLADGDRGISLDGLHRHDEIGGMAAAVEVFRRHLVERDAARDALEKVNENLEEKIESRSSELRIANAALQAEVQERIQANNQLKAMQEGLIRTENLAVIGQLSAGIAHELNQPLAALATLSENARRFLERGDHETARSNLDRIVRMVERMGILTGRLRSFARRTGAEREDVDLGRSVENALALLGHRQDREPLRVVSTPSKEPVWVHANAVRVEQILVNLVSNAFDATREVAEPCVEIAWQTRDGQAVLTVTDNGSGFAPDILTRIFEPFFTTKKKSGGGLGLGLAISADIARIYGGSLSAADAPGGGAVFTLTLPLLGSTTESSPPSAPDGNPDTRPATTPEGEIQSPFVPRFGL